jgi:glycosyltransferase involved in cell wall biosynthesis
MRIMQIISGGDINGAIVYCRLLSRELVRRGHEVVLVSRPHSWIAGQLRGEGIECIESDLRRWPTTELRRVADVVRRRKIDVVHTHMSRAHAFGILLRMMTGAATVATAHNRYIQLHWMFNDYVIGTSAAATRFHRRFNLVQRRASGTIHCFIDAKRFAKRDENARREIRAAFGVGENDVLVGQVGDIIPRKGLLHLVRALPRILTAQPRVKLLVVGDHKGTADYLAQVRQEAEALGVDGAIRWAGHRRDIPQVLSALDVYVLASLEESFPLSILEAMASGLPVVATAVGGIPECVVPGDNGFLARPGDPAPLAAAITRLAQSAKLRQRLGSAGREQVLANFDVETAAPRIEKVYEGVSRPKRRAA